MKKAIGITAIIVLVMLILTNLIGWSFYNLIHFNVGNFLDDFGLNDPNIQNSFIIVGGMILLLVLGYFAKTKTNVFGWIK